MEVTIASTAAQRLRGLFGRTGEVDVLLLLPCNDVHTFGMRNPIDVAFVASDGRVLESHRNVGAFRRLRCRRASATLERFSRESSWFEPGDFVKISKSDIRFLEERGNAFGHGRPTQGQG